MKTFNCLVPDWEEMQNLAKAACDKIKKSDFYPNIILGISRGGLVPARLFSDYLHIKDIATIKADHWGVTATKDGTAKIKHSSTADFSGKNVLIVDDVTDTGQSMDIVKEHILGQNPKSVKTATLYNLKGSKHTPDFYGKEIDWIWIIFPWNYQEDLMNIIGQIQAEEEKNLDDLHKTLKEDFKVETRKEKLKEIMEHIEFIKKKQ
ncbi:MAG: phosphoribosyltransferase [archaeon]